MCNPSTHNTFRHFRSSSKTRAIPIPRTPESPLPNSTHTTPNPTTNPPTANKAARFAGSAGNRIPPTLNTTPNKNDLKIPLPPTLPLHLPTYTPS
jgi:hypothetical protein